MTTAIHDSSIVKRIEGDFAFVKIVDNGLCEHCGIRIICSPHSKYERGILARNPFKAKVGQNVVITDSQNLLKKLSVMLYGLPLLGFVLGVFTAYLLDVSLPYVADEVLLFFSGTIGLFLCSIISRKWLKRISVVAHTLFQISRVHSED